MANRRNEMWVGVLIAAALAVLAWLSVMVGAISGLGPTIDVTLRMKDAAGIAGGATVSIAGVQVGRVESMTLDRDTAVAMLRLDADANIPRDVSARIRARSVLGEKYLELVPNTKEGPLLVAGDTLEISAEQIEIDEMVSTAGVLLEALDVEALGAAIRAVTDALREDPQRMERAFDHVDTILSNTSTASNNFPALSDKATALTTRLDGTLDRADRLLDSLQARADEARSPLEKADTLLSDLRSASEPLPDAIKEGREAIAKASTALDKASSTLDSAKALIGDFDGIDKDVKRILSNFAEIDKWELRRLLREEGILIRLKPDEVIQSPSRSKDVVPRSGEHSP